MNVWLIKMAEPSPIGGHQLGRVGTLADTLCKCGNRVVWWKSTFYHSEKKYYYNKDTQIDLCENEKLVYLHSPIAYKKNISVSRILFYKILARRFRKLSQDIEKPDIILCAWPSIFLAREAVRYGTRNNIPVILDVRDLWPSIFAEKMPRALAKILMPMLDAWARKILSRATGITSVQEFALKWACDYIGREQGVNDVAFYNSTRAKEVPNDKIKECDLWMQNLGITKDTWNMCFWGSLRKNGLDLDTCIKAVLILKEKYPDIRLIIGGEGDSKNYLEKLANNSDSIIFAGYVNGFQMTSVMRVCKLGVYSLVNTPDFINTISNKAIQYMSMGIPVLNSLKGFTRDLLCDNNAGITYEEGDVTDCARAIEEIYKSEKRQLEMATNALNLYSEKFDSEKINKDFVDYLNRIAEEYSRENRK